ncbi:hypothetical protein [Bacillus pumilus]|uniref:hypothetical protein n=1 Tax=Bacillus pumilus TaxID=1408 RepID=UPI001CB93B00|nr:hypothetical protein [Bacillus pumilus]
MSIWKTFRYSFFHFLIAFMLFSMSFLRKPNGGQWMLIFMVLIGHRVFFRGIYASPENKQSERGSTAQQVSLFHHVPNWDDTYPVCLFSITHESFDIKLFFCCLKKSETRGDFAASY